MACKNLTLNKLKKLQRGQYLEIISEFDIKHSSAYPCYLSKNGKLFCRIETVLNKIIMKQTKSGHCEQCGRDEEEIMRFSDNEIFRCSYCMMVEGLCQKCVIYIPFPDENFDMNFSPKLCDECDNEKKM